MNKHVFKLTSYSARVAKPAAGPAPVRSCLKAGSPEALLDRLPRIEPAVLESLNRLFRGDRRISFEWPDGSVGTVVLLPEFKTCLNADQSVPQAAPQVICNKKQGIAVKEVYRRHRNQSTELVIEARLGRNSISIGLASAAFLELLDGENAALLPAHMKCALLESYLDSAVRAFEQAGGLLISIASVTHNPLEWPDRGCNLFFEVQREEGRTATSGCLSLDVQGLACLARLFKHHDHPPAWDRIGHLRLPVGFVLGSARLRLSQINRLAGDDVILFDSITGQGSRPLSIRIDVAQRPFWLAKKTGNHLIVEKRLEHLMKENAKEVVWDDEEMADLEEIELELIFELGRMSMSLAEVRRIGRGYVFDLGGAFSKPVCVSINGGRVGSGELVKIDNRLGVRLTRSLQRQDDHDR